MALITGWQLMRIGGIRGLCSIAALLFLLCGQPPAQAASSSNELAAGAPIGRLKKDFDETTTVTLNGNRPPLATAANDIGAVDDALRLERLILVLKPDANQSAALEAFLVSVRDHASPHFGQWMTGKDFARHFGVADADMAIVSQWLIRHGFTIDEIPTGGRAIVFSGTVASIRATFHTEIHRYLYQGAHHLANAGDPQIPGELAAVVDGLVSLHDFHSRPLNTRQTANPDYTNGSTHYLAPADFQTIYDLSPLSAQAINGSGRSIAILGRSNVNVSDIQTFRSSMNLPTNPPEIIVNGSDPGLVSGDEGESDLDLEWSGAVAPAATIKFVTSMTTATTDGIDLSAQYAVSNNVADIVSLSYGQCEASLGSAALSFYNNLWQQAAAQGMTVVVSSGDSGAAGCDISSASRATQGRGVNGLCSSPYSTCVGGTELADTANPSLYWASGNTGYGSALSYIPEVVWNESGANGGQGLWASGGGASSHYTKPAWQNTPGVPADGKRDVPDIALAAATHDGYLVYSSDNATQTQTLYAFGGTSAAAPSFAGILALVAQKTGYRLGAANPTLYGLATHQANGGGTYFHNVTSGNNSVPGVTGFSASTNQPFYNQATGLGSVDGNQLVTHWTDLLPVSSTTIASSSNPGVFGQNLTLTATVSASAPTGSVQFFDNGSSLGATVALTGTVATLTTSALAIGSHNLTAAYSGDPNNQASTSPLLALTIVSPSSVTLSPSATSIVIAQPISLTASVSGLSPTGTVQFMDGGSSLGAPVSLSNAAASLNTNALTTLGSHAISATYSGDAANAASTSAVVVVSVTKDPSSISITSSAPSVTVGQSITLTAVIVGIAPTGTVQFMDGSTLVGTASVSGGVASLVTSTLGVGNHTLSAIYSGDANNLGSASAVLSEIVSATNGEVPTLPEWGQLLLGGLLMGLAWRRRPGN